MAHHMRSNIFASECGAVPRNCRHMLVQDVCDAITSQRLAVTIHEDVLMVLSHRYAPQSVQRIYRLAPQR